MDSIERVKKILTHEVADRVPRDFWSTEQTDNKLLRTLKLENREEILKKFDIDFRYIMGPKYIGPVLKKYADGAFKDIWGTKLRKAYIGKEDKSESYFNVIENPLGKLGSLKDIKDYGHWPSSNWFDYSVVYEQCQKYPNKVVMFMGNRLNRIAQLKPAIYLRGMENILLDMYINRDIFNYIIFKISEFYKEYTKKILSAARGKIGILVTGDDFGTQDGMIMSVRDWKKNFKQGFKKYIELAHSFDVLVMHHTCGSVYELIPEFIDCGLDILQSLQPDTKDMDFKKIKKEFGKYISFQGGIGIQKSLPLGKPKEIFKEVENTLNIMKKNGGYIACTSHNIQADTPVTNILALIEAYDRYG
jgi:uroporphyrinogen decarboxylase